MGGMSVNFVHLTYPAALDVVGDVFFYARPPVMGLDESEGVGNSGMSSSF